MIFDKLKEDIKEAMKSGEILKRDLIRTLAGDCSKNDKSPSDEACIAMIKKFKKNAEETQKVLASGSDIKVNDFNKLTEEIKILESYLPKQMDENEIQLVIAACILTGTIGMGPIQKHFKENFAGTYDGALLAKCIKEYRCNG